MRFFSAEIDAFKAALRHSGRMSVDAFLETRVDLIKIGKAMMAVALSMHEHHSALFLEQKKGENWYDYLFASMFSPSIYNIASNRISFITYNYDRSLEAYLATAIENSYNAQEKDVREALKNVAIIHLHGKLGNLPIEGGKAKRYQAEMTKEEFIIAQESIRIIHEVEDNAAEFERAYQYLEDAEQVCFLGFGYNQTNMLRLRLARCTNVESFYGTVVGMTPEEISSLGKALNNRFGSRNSSILSFLRETGVIQAQRGNLLEHV